MSGFGSSELAALRVSGLRLPVAVVPPGGRFTPPPEPLEIRFRQEAALMSGQLRERARPPQGDHRLPPQLIPSEAAAGQRRACVVIAPPVSC